MAYLGDFIYYLQSAGVYDFALPFLLVFTIIFAVLEKTKLFGTEPDGRAKSNINLVLALVIGLIVIVNTEIVDVMNQYLSRMALFIVILLIVILTFGIFGANAETGFSGFAFLLFMIISIFAVILALAPTLGLFDFFYYFTERDLGFIFMIIIFIVILGVLMHRPSPRGAGFAGFINSLINGFKGGR